MLGSMFLRMIVRLPCPHCDSTHTEQMEDRRNEEQSAITWYQCLDCRRMWSVPKPPSRPSPASNDESPKSSGS